MKLRTQSGESIALASIAAVVVRRVLDAGRVDARRGRRVGTASAPASAAASSRRLAGGRPIAVGYLPKDIVNQYFAAAKTGIDKAAAELGGTVTQVGPNEAKADLQIPFITDLTTQGVDAIIISADGKDEVAPALKAAMDAGIKVVGFDSSPAVGAYDVFVNQVDFSGVGVNLADWACELAPDCTGEIAILSAAATATNQNAWIELHDDHPRRKTKYKGLKLVETVYGDDDATKSTQQAQALLTKYPNLKVIVAPTTVGILAAAQVVKQAGKSDSVKVTGLGFPNDMKPFVADGTSPVFGLWSVPDLGYLVVRRRRQARQRRDHRGRGRDLHASRASTTTSRTPSARTASSSSGRPSGSTRRTSTTSTSSPASPIADHGPRRRRFRGPDRSRRNSMERDRVHDAAPAGRRRPSTAGGTRRSGRRCSPRSRRAGAATTRSSSAATTCSATSRSTTSRAFRASMAASAVNDRWQARDGGTDRPADRSGDRVPPAPRGDLPPRLSPARRVRASPPHAPPTLC